MVKKTEKITIGLEKNQALLISQKLNVLLASYSVLGINLRGYHWNVRGSVFFDLHSQFESLYADLENKIDEIAERILTLDGEPVHAFSQYLYLSEIEEHVGVTSGRDCAKGVLDSLIRLVACKREILKWAQDWQDEGTASIISDNIREHEKLIWQYKAYLSD